MRDDHDAGLPVKSMERSSLLSTGRSDLSAQSKRRSKVGGAIRVPTEGERAAYRQRGVNEWVEQTFNGPVDLLNSSVPRSVAELRRGDVFICVVNVPILFSVRRKEVALIRGRRLESVQAGKE